MDYEKCYVCHRTCNNLVSCKNIVCYKKICQLCRYPCYHCQNLNCNEHTTSIFSRVTLTTKHYCKYCYKLKSSSSKQ